MYMYITNILLIAKRKTEKYSCYLLQEYKGNMLKVCSLKYSDEQILTNIFHTATNIDFH